jgi:N-acetylmuramic acid 6-phosphate etherase
MPDQPLDLMPAIDIIAEMDKADARAMKAVQEARGVIAAAAEGAASAIGQGGRLIYVGAGTSGRLGVLDASECPPTFSSLPEQVVGVIAGGKKALYRSVEGAEDNKALGRAAISRLKVGKKDMVVGISASGTAPYVLAALDEAGRRGADTWLINCSPLPSPSPTCGGRDNGWGALKREGGCKVISLPTGPEVIQGSSRLAAGTATKLALNRISTAAFVMLGKVYGDLMVDVMPTNAKLVTRGV